MGKQAALLRSSGAHAMGSKISVQEAISLYTPLDSVLKNTRDEELEFAPLVI
jgi:hypothetical protein